VGAIAIASGSLIGQPYGSAFLYLWFGQGVPSQEYAVLGPAPAIPAIDGFGFVSGLSITVGPSALPVSAIAGAIDVPPSNPSSSPRWEALVMNATTTATNRLPLAVAPANSTPAPASLTFQTGPDYAGTVTTLTPGTSYFVEVVPY
jgi:hypothetical protein